MSTVIRANKPKEARVPDFQWDTSVCGVNTTVDIFCEYQKSYPGTLETPPEIGGMIVEYAELFGERVESNEIIRVCQEYCDEMERG